MADKENTGPPRKDDYFAWPEGAKLKYYDKDGNEVSKEEWRELGCRKAAEREAKPVSDPRR